MSLTIQILIKNNESTIEKCLESLMSLKSTITLIDLGSTDNTLSICRRLGFKTERHINNDDRSVLRNKLLTKSRTKWQMYLEPHEELISGHEHICESIKYSNPESYRFKILQGTVLTKEIRLWNKPLQFMNPVYETIRDNSTDLTECLILSHQQKINTNENLIRIENWKKTHPLAQEPYYYQALTLLLQGKYADFIELANHYLFKNKTGTSSVMLRYYLAMVQDDPNSACRNILTCISQNPLMAEFWCLLGDIHFKMKKHHKAFEFYDNAIILGSRRILDDYPMDIVKYKEYPAKMMEKIKHSAVDQYFPKSVD